MSQRLVDAVHNGETDIAIECLLNPSVDVNFIGTVLLKSKTTEIELQDELPHRVNSVYEEFKTDVTALFLAAHSGNLSLLRKLLC
ncbi:ankyrin repeat domain-containing protein [Trifolium pratense]|uniref:Ankyrin repeat domain-containing protein n=1 Tax=Trifolium pratense TaxID=57577 RepID=A0A2K3LSB3_TRIPR|nr:ankyrin repeat domain-containing protein [Trifolium pratense]